LIIVCAAVPSAWRIQ